MESEKTTLLNPEQDVEPSVAEKILDGAASTNTDDAPRVYGVRWWTLLVCSLSIGMQTLFFLIWMPLSDSMLIAYDWDVSYIGLAGASTSLTFVVLALPVMNIIESKGLRVGMLISNISGVIASVLWNISLHTNTFWVFVIGSIFNGILLCSTLVVPSLFSVTWFPVSQRTTATSICVFSASVGSLVAFLAGPQITGSHVTAENVLHRDNLTTEFITEVANGIQNVGYFVLGIAVSVLVLAIIYFPAAPPTPPSIAQTVRREDFWSGLQKLKKNSQFWIICSAFNLTNSPTFAWLPLLAVHFRNLGLDEDEASWISIAATVAGGTGIFVIGLLADRAYFQRKTKAMLRGFSVISIILILLLALIQCEYIYISPGSLIPLLCGLLICLNITTQSIFPVCSELACEYAYPVYEGLTSTVTLMISCSLSILLYGLLLVPTLSENTAWMTWVCLVGCSISLPLLFLLKDDFRRLDLDNPASTKESPKLNYDEDRNNGSALL